MPLCDVTLDDLPQFDGVPAGVKDVIIGIATTIVLGPTECNAANYAKWKCACQDPCNAIKMLAAHILSVDPDIGIGSQSVKSERVGDVSASYADPSSAAGMWGDSIYGRLYVTAATQVRAKSSTRSTFPLGVGGFAGC